MLVIGVVGFVVSTFAMMGLYVWASWGTRAPRRVRYVPPRYLVICAAAMIGSLVVIAASGSMNS
ncbi:MAG: hypothetical protein ACXVRK_10735 [Gaiellaceae bacterium]